MGLPAWSGEVDPSRIDVLGVPAGYHFWRNVQCFLQVPTAIRRLEVGLWDTYTFEQVTVTVSRIGRAALFPSVFATLLRVEPSLLKRPCCSTDFHQFQDRWGVASSAKRLETWTSSGQTSPEGLGLLMQISQGHGAYLALPFAHHNPAPTSPLWRE